MNSRGDLFARFARPGPLWAAVFLYTILAGLFIQLVLLPYVFPSWHAGQGLLRGVDAPEFHRIAMELTRKVKALGWSQWTLAPENQPVSGVAALVYVLIYPSPWALLPLNGLLNAFACVGVFLILRRFAADASAALLATLPFVLFPSNLIWNSQMHNENYAIPGVVGILFGWMLLVTVQRASLRRQAGTVLVGLASILVGSLLLSMVRHLVLAGMTYLLVVTATALAVFWLLRRPTWLAYVGRVTLVAAACGAMLLAGIPKVDDGAIILRDAQSEQEAPPTQSRRTKAINEWTRTPTLPSAVDGQLRDLAAFRYRFVRSWGKGGSTIDADIAFHSAAEFAAFLPRALQIGLFSPFPHFWFTSSDRPAGNGMRAASAVEMPLAYAFLLGLPLFLWRNRKQPAAWMILFVCIAMLAVYAAIIPNVGALYRFRYPYFMPLVCMGLLGWISRVQPQRAAGALNMPA